MLSEKVLIPSVNFMLASSFDLAVVQVQIGVGFRLTALKQVDTFELQTF